MGSTTIAGGAVNGEVVATQIALTAGATISMDMSKGNIFTLSQTDGTAGTINATNVVNGEYVTLVVTTTGTTGETLTLGTNFKSTGTLAVGTVSGKVFTLKFVTVGGTLYELSRTTAM